MRGRVEVRVRGRVKVRVRVRGRVGFASARRTFIETGKRVGKLFQHLPSPPPCPC